MPTLTFKSAKALDKALTRAAVKSANRKIYARLVRTTNFLYENMIIESPSDTGNFRNSFRVSEGHPDNSGDTWDPPSTPPKQGSPPTPEERANSGIDSLKIRNRGYRIFITNNATAKNGYRYANNVEYTGWSNKSAYAPMTKASVKLMSSSLSKGLKIK